MDSLEIATGEESFRVETVQRDARSVLVLAGQIGWEATPRLRDEAETLAACAGVDLDWKEAQALTGSCLQVLIALANAVSDCGQTCRVVADSPEVRRQLEWAGVSARFPGPVPAEPPAQHRAHCPEAKASR